LEVQRYPLGIHGASMSASASESREVIRRKELEKLSDSGDTAVGCSETSRIPGKSSESVHGARATATANGGTPDRSVMLFAAAFGRKLPFPIKDSKSVQGARVISTATATAIENEGTQTGR
jgi:hypothetical protein